MPNDAIIYYRQAKFLNDTLSEGKIDKITMPSADIIELFIRSHGNNYCLLLSAEASRSRIQLTDSPLPTLPVAPSFLMHLRKHIGNGKILSIKSVKYERIVIITILKTDELFETTQKQLIIEVIGKYSNIILVSADGRISESIRHIPLDATSKRQILPSMKYTFPEAQNKLTLADNDQFKQTLSLFDGSGLYNYVMKNLAGFSPISIKEAIFRVFGAKDYSGNLSPKSIDLLEIELNNLYEEPSDPCVYYDDDKIIDFSATEYKSLGQDKKVLSLGKAMDLYYSEKMSMGKSVDPEKKKLETEIRHSINKAFKRIENFRQKELENADFESFRIKGELLTAFLYKVIPGTDSITVENYYDGKETVIQLDKQKSPQQNAQFYYKKYSKMKRTVEMCHIQINKAEKEIESLEELSLNLSICDKADELDEVYEEAANLGFNTKKQKHRKKIAYSSPLKITYEGYEILIGKNSAQNERITKAAKPEDIWLHASKIPGCHTIIKNIQGGAIPDTVIENAARYCAYFSKAGTADKVPVDYTFKKHVSKPKDAPMGKFVYTNQKTIYVSPLKPL